MNEAAAQELEDRLARRMLLRHQLGPLRLSEFTVDELGAILRLCGLHQSGVGTVNVGDRDMDLLEAHVKQTAKP